LANAFEKILGEYGIQNKVRQLSACLFDLSEHTLQAMSLAMDNASSNDTQMESLGTSDATSISPENRVRCFAHTLNLSAKALLKPFTASLDDEATAAPPPADDDTDDDDMPELMAST
jgi:hypothetical protein